MGETENKAHAEKQNSPGSRLLAHTRPMAAPGGQRWAGEPQLAARHQATAGSSGNVREQPPSEPDTALLSLAAQVFGTGSFSTLGEAT